MLTELGKYLRSLRGQNGELLKDMASKLAMSPSMLSSIEGGTRNVSKDFVKKLVGVYRLSLDQQEKLQLAVAQTRKEVTVNLQGLSQTDQQLAFSFARKFSDLDDESKISIRRILGEEGDKN